MEFEDNQPTDDEHRLLTEAKKVIIKPLHTGVMPDPIPDAEIAAHTNTTGTTPNTLNDTEDTSVTQLVPPTKSALDKATIDTPSRTTGSHPVAPALVTLLLIATIGITFWLWIQAN
jgi:hypothetical protein